MKPRKPRVADHQLQQRGIGRHAAAIHFIRHTGIIEQHLVKLQELPAEIAEARTVLFGHQGVRRLGTGGAPRRGGSSEKRVEIQPLGHHLHRAVRFARPSSARPIPVQLDAIAVGVAQIQRFTDTVIARAFERHAGLTEPSERIAERRAVRIPDRKVIQAGRAGRRRASALAFPGVETDVVVIAASAEKYRRLPHALGHFETEDAGVKRHGTLEVGDFQVNVTDLGAGIDRLGHTP